MTLLEVGRPRDALPPAADAYVDPAVFQKEHAEVFRRTWQVAALAADVTKPGSYSATSVCGIPVVVTRDGDGTLRALTNVCRHRGALIASGCGPARNLVCPNHSWVYGLDGALIGAPRTANEPDFDAQAIHLPQLGVHEWGQLVLVNLDGAAEPPGRELDVVDAGLARYGLRFADLTRVSEVIDWSIEANWKIVIENYLECYHCSRVHPDLSRVIDTSAERYALEPDGDLLSATSPVRPGDGTGRQQEVLRTEGPVTTSWWHLLFPTTTINVYPGQGAVEITWYWPLTPGTTGARTVVFAPATADDAYIGQVMGLLTRVGEEDNAICEAMQVGMASGTLPRPILLHGAEALLRHFHDRLAGRQAVTVEAAAEVGR